MVDELASRGVAPDRRKVVLGLGLVAVSALALARQPMPNRPRIKDDKFKDMMPAQVGDYRFDTESGLVLPPKDALSDRIYDDLVTRTYTNSAGQVVMLLVAYNNRQDGVLQIHRPEICYPAGGYTLSQTKIKDVPFAPGAEVPAKIFVARSDARNEVVLYWTRIGNHFPSRWIDQRLAVAEANLRGIIPDGILVRVSTLSQIEQDAVPDLEEFIIQLYRSLPLDGRTLLFGKA